MAGQIGGVLGSFPLGSFLLGAAGGGAVVDQDFEWAINATTIVDFNTTWSYDSLPEKWYRVVGKPFESGAEEINIDTGQEGRQIIIQYMAASNLNDLCRKLKEGFLTGPYEWPIEEIGQFTRPVRPTEEELQEVNELIPVPFCTSPDCKELCIDIDKTTQMGTNDRLTGGDDLFSYEGTGGMETSGEADTSFTT